MTTRDLAEKIYQDLNKNGAGLGNASIGIINQTLESHPSPVVIDKRELLLAFYQHLLNNDPFPIQQSAKHREVDRFLSANNCALSGINPSEICEVKGHQVTYGDYYGEIICERCGKKEFEEM